MTYSRVQINCVRLPILFMVSWTGENFLAPVRTWEFGFARQVWLYRLLSACSFSILTLNLVLTHGIPQNFGAASIHFYQHHTPSGQSRVYRVTQLRTDCVHCRESVSTGPVVLKVVRITVAAFASPWTKCYCAPLFSHTHYWYTVEMSKLPGVYKVYKYQNISTTACCSLLLYCLWNCFLFFPPTYTVQYRHMLYFKT